VLGLDVTTSPQEIRSRVGYMPESDGHIPGHERRVVRRLLRRAVGPARGRRHAARARSASTTSAWARRATARSAPTRPA
jgi:ABC-type multidrug transport system ATPase subunit